MSGLIRDARLWKEFVPLAFHVDYWNYLGWNDPLSDPAYSRRQRGYAHKGYTRSVYTPGFFTNGREWSGWFIKPTLSRSSAPQTGILTLRITDQELTADYEATSPKQANSPTAVPLLLHVAILGFNINNPVSGGENRGKTLTHDFVVMAWHAQSDNHANRHWQFKRDAIGLSNLSQRSQQHAAAIAAWVSAIDDPTPLQATGGWLEPHAR